MYTLPPCQSSLLAWLFKHIPCRLFFYKVSSGLPSQAHMYHLWAQYAIQVRPSALFFPAHIGSPGREHSKVPPRLALQCTYSPTHPEASFLIGVGSQAHTYGCVPWIILRPSVGVVRLCTYRPVKASVRHWHTDSSLEFQRVQVSTLSSIAIPQALSLALFSYNSFAFHLTCTLARRSSNYFHLAGEAKCHQSSVTSRASILLEYRWHYLFQARIAQPTMPSRSSVSAWVFKHISTDVRIRPLGF